MGKPSKGAILRAVDPKVVELVDAASGGDVRKVRKIVSSGKVEIDDDVDGVTALMKACGAGHMKVIEELLRHGAGMWCVGPTDDPMTPFMWAAHYGQLEVVRYFVEEVGMDDAGMNKGAGNSGKKTAMDYALDAGHCDEQTVAKKFEVQAYLIERGAKYGEGVTDPQTVFDGAARGDVNYVHYCLEANRDMVRVTHGVERSSLLHVAGNTGNFDLMKNLISHGANLEARNILGRTPLMSAAIAGHVAVLRYLMTYDGGVTLESRDATGDTALHHACEAGHLECVRALLSRDVPSANPDDQKAMSITNAMLNGDPLEAQDRARKLSPCELLQMKNRSSHTPIIKAFAGGVHVDVIRYVVGAMDGNVDPIRAGELGADPPPMLSRQLSTDGIDLIPLPPEEVEAKLDRSGGGVIFSCALDDDQEEDKGGSNAEAKDEVEELKEELSTRDLAPGGEFPVRVPPGPATLGHRRLVRFLDTMPTAVWGFDIDKVCVMSRTAVLSAPRMSLHAEATRKGMLVKLSEIPPRANLLYVCHRWETQGEPDCQEHNTFMQLKRYLEEPAGEGIHYIWLDASCVDVAGRDSVLYDQYMTNILTVIARSTHLLAIPPCKTMDPVALIHDLAQTKMNINNTARPPNILKRLPPGLRAKFGVDVDGGAGESKDKGGANQNPAGGLLADNARQSRKSHLAMVERVLKEAVTNAIIARKELDPEKWAAVLCEPSASQDDAAAGGSSGNPAASQPADRTKVELEGVAGVPDVPRGPSGSEVGATGGEASAAGGGRAMLPPSLVSGGVTGIGGDKGGGSTVPHRKSSPGGVPSGSKGGRSGTREDGSRKRFSNSGKKGAESEVQGPVLMEGLTKKERRALEEQKAKEQAANAASDAADEIAVNHEFLTDTILYSDPVALLNRGWVEMEVSLALIFGVQVHVCVRWGPKVSFQTVLVKPVRAGDEEGDEQAVGFKGAFVQAIERVAPDAKPQKGYWTRLLGGPEPTADPAVPVAVVLAGMLDNCHEPQTVVAPLVRSSLALHDESTLIPYVAGELSPIQLMYRLSGLALQDVKDGFSGLGPISIEADRLTLVRMYILGLSYTMGIIPRGTRPVGKPKWQLQRDLREAEQRIKTLEVEVDGLKRQQPTPTSKEQVSTTVQAPSGCNCVLM